MAKQDADWVRAFLDSPIGLFAQAVGEKQIHSTPGGKNIRLKQSLGHGDDFIDALILNDIRRRNRANSSRSNIPVRPAGMELPHHVRNRRVSVKGLHAPVENTQLIEQSLRALLSGSAPMGPGDVFNASTRPSLPEFPFAR